MPSFPTRQTIARLVVACIGLLAPSAQAATTTTHPKLAAFSALAISGRFDLHYATAPTRSVTLTGDRYVIHNLRIAVIGHALTIARPHGLDLPKRATITLTITSPDLTALHLRGLVRAKLQGLHGTSFTLINDGAAAASLAGTPGHFLLTSRGVASIDASALHAKTLTMFVRGQGNFRVFASHSAKITMYGEGRVDVFGHPPIHQFKALAYGIITLK